MGFQITSSKEVTCKRLQPQISHNRVESVMKQEAHLMWKAGLAASQNIWKKENLTYKQNILYTDNLVDFLISAQLHIRG